MRTQLWGILNVTPDSFSDGGEFFDEARAYEHAQTLLEQGADVIDVGGQSTRPLGNAYGTGAELISTAEELRRVTPVVQALCKQLKAVVSVDTFNAKVADVALGLGARIINDVSCGQNPELLEVVATHDAELVLMHTRGRGQVCPENTQYDNVVADVKKELLLAVERAQKKGVDQKKIWIDPGIGFAKTAPQSLMLLSHLSSFKRMGFRVLLGASRKSFIREVMLPFGRTPSALEREPGTQVSSVFAVLAQIEAVRVHDVKMAFQTLKVTEALLQSNSLIVEGASPA